MKILPCGVAIIEDDTHVSRWVEQSGTLRIAEKELSPFRKYVPEGGVVVDAGAMIGDHTATYADWVGERGVVYAFEPNVEAYDCLIENTKKLAQVFTFNIALGDWISRATLHSDVNAGASYLSSELGGDVRVHPLDFYGLTRLDFLKMDVEGFETRLLRGAKDTIARCRPVILSEVNAGALERSGSSTEELRAKLFLLEYRVTITDSRVLWSERQYDVICVPNERQ